MTVPKEEPTVSASEPPVTEPEPDKIVLKMMRCHQRLVQSVRWTMHRVICLKRTEEGQRSQDADDTKVKDSFRKNFPPLKSRRPSHVPGGMEVSNPFSALDLVSDAPLVIDDSWFDTEMPTGTGDDLLGLTCLIDMFYVKR